MAKMSGGVPFLIDSDPANLLRDDTAAAITATTAETGISLNRLTQAWWDNNEVPAGNIEVGVHVSEMDRTTGDETVTFTLEVGPSGFGSAVAVATSGPVTSTGSFKMEFDAKRIEQLGTTYTHLRIKATVAGTTPSVKYGAWLVCGDF